MSFLYYSLIICYIFLRMGLHFTFICSEHAQMNSLLYKTPSSSVCSFCDPKSKGFLNLARCLLFLSSGCSLSVLICCTLRPSSNFKYLLNFYVYACVCAWVYVCVPSVCRSLRRPDYNIGSPEPWVKDGCELTGWRWKQNPRPLSFL